ncbi:hypothetical protein ACGP04_09285 [Piscirickettsia salmonis]|uniref:hypothetical protein n=1 Tax=Piscirickettsia salmonis TaxID=1238 RepID=UPI00375341DC
MSKEKQLKKIANNIKQIMEHQDPPINKQQLADRSNISYPTLVPILQGVRDFGITKLINIAEALNVSPNEILNKTYTERDTTSKKLSNNIEYYGIFISSADSTYCYFYNKITDETSYFVTEFIISCSLNYIDIIDNIKSTIEKTINSNFKNMAIFCSVQEYEFSKKRELLISYGKKHFNFFAAYPDWKTNYHANFNNESGICIVINDGLSISYKEKNKNQIFKTQGLGFPIADEGGNLWLGWQAIRYAIKVRENLKNRSKLSDKILAVFNFNLYEISEQISNTPNKTYNKAANILKNQYFQECQEAKSIINLGGEKIQEYILEIDNKIEDKLPVCITGDLSYLYQKYIPNDRLALSNKDQEELIRDYAIDVLNKAQKSI